MVCLQQVEGNILCSIFKRDCYVAFINCSCYLHPVCLRHEFTLLNLPCGNNFTISVREDILEIEAVAMMFEQEKDIATEVEKQSGIATDMILLSKMYPVTENEAYNPYCRIGVEFYLNIANVEDEFDPGCTLKQCSTEILDTSANVYQDSDESDSETFRVKRRSSSKLEHRNTPESVPSSFENQVIYGDVYMLDDKMEWHKMPPLPKPDSHIEASWALLNNSIVIAGGTTEKNHVTKRMILVGELFRFDLDSLKWHVIGKLPYRVKTTQAAYWNGWFYITSGQRDKGPDNPQPKKVVADLWRTRLSL